MVLKLNIPIELVRYRVYNKEKIKKIKEYMHLYKKYAINQVYYEPKTPEELNVEEKVLTRKKTITALFLENLKKSLPTVDADSYLETYKKYLAPHTHEETLRELFAPIDLENIDKTKVRDYLANRDVYKAELDAIYDKQYNTIDVPIISTDAGNSLVEMFMENDTQFNIHELTPQIPVYKDPYVFFSLNADYIKQLNKKMALINKKRKYPYYFFKDITPHVGSILSRRFTQYIKKVLVSKE